MPQLGSKHASVLRNYPRAVVHLRQQVSSGRFGFIFGSGLSVSFQIPGWEDLVERLARDYRIWGVRLLKTAPPRAGAPYRTEMLFEHYRKRCYDRALPDKHHTRELDYRITSEWRAIVRHHLYAEAPSNFRGELTRHPYFKACLPLIRKAYMTVTYNFDDFIEQALFLTNPPEKRDESRGYECVTNPWTQFRRSNSIIFHPNGVIPQKAMEAPSDRFVFSESSFSEQILGMFAGGQGALLNHLSKNTCLLIGLSLEDETLRSLLAQNAQTNPGNYHYYVYYLKPHQTLDINKQNVIRLANFKVYNLLTLFLDSTRIRALLDLINPDSCQAKKFVNFAQEKNIGVCFRFYLTGSMGVGKSTTLNSFRNLTALDEWLDQRPEVLAKPWDTLNDEEKSAADKWVAHQFRLKNDILKDEREGVFMLDRGPLDPLSFTDAMEWKSKAGRLLRKICPSNVDWKVQDGRVIFLQGDPRELGLRNVLAGRYDYDEKRLQKNEEMLARAYGETGVVQVDTRGITASDVARRVAEIVHLEEYDPICDLHERLVEFKKRGLDAAN